MNQPPSTRKSTDLPATQISNRKRPYDRNGFGVKRDRVKIAKGSEKPVNVYYEKLTNRLLLYIEDNVSLRDKTIVQPCSTQGSCQ